MTINTYKTYFPPYFGSAGLVDARAAVLAGETMRWCGAAEVKGLSTASALDISVSTMQGIQVSVGGRNFLLRTSEKVDLETALKGSQGRATVHYLHLAPKEPIALTVP